jgi:hypothetical protein
MAKRLVQVTVTVEVSQPGREQPPEQRAECLAVLLLGDRLTGFQRWHEAGAPITAKALTATCKVRRQKAAG